MSSRIGKTFVFGGLALGAAAVQNAVAATLAGWNFENLVFSNGSSAITAASVGPIAADTGSGSGFGVHAAATSVWSTPAGNGSFRSLSSNVWTGGNSDYYEFQTSSTGYEDLIVSFDQTRSGTGPNSFDFQYSTDGSSFTSFSTYTLAGTGWTPSSAATAAGNSFVMDLSAITGLDNASNVYFRFRNNGVNSSGGTVASGGTSRVDNVFVTATEIPEPTAVALVTLAGAAAMTRRRSQAK